MKCIPMFSSGELILPSSPRVAKMSPILTEPEISQIVPKSWDFKNDLLKVLKHLCWYLFSNSYSSGFFPKFDWAWFWIIVRQFLSYFSVTWRDRPTRLKTIGPISFRPKAFPESTSSSSPPLLSLPWWEQHECSVETIWAWVFHCFWDIATSFSNRNGYLTHSRTGFQAVPDEPQFSLTTSPQESSQRPCPWSAPSSMQFPPLYLQCRVYMIFPRVDCLLQLAYRRLGNLLSIITVAIRNSRYWFAERINQGSPVFWRYFRTCISLETPLSRRLGSLLGQC